MNLEDNMEIVLSLRRKIIGRPIGISWASGEQYTSSSLRKSKRKGPGLQFLGQKIYDAADGDDPRRIDQNATAAEAEDESGDQDMIIQTFRNPRIVRVHAMLDLSKSMNLGTKGTFKSLLGALMAGCSIASARKVNDLASFVTYSYRPVTVLKCQNAGRLLTPALVHAVGDRDFDSAESPAADGGADVEGGGLTLAMKTISHKSSNLVSVISDFVNMNEDDWEAMRVCGLRNDTVAVFVQDRRERQLPAAPWPGMPYRLEDFRGRELSLFVAPDNAPGWYLKQLRKIFGSVTTAREYAENFARHEARILERLEACNVTTIVVSTDDEDAAVQQLLALLANKMRT